MICLYSKGKNQTEKILPKKVQSFALFLINKIEKINKNPAKKVKSRRNKELNLRFVSIEKSPTAKIPPKIVKSRQKEYRAIALFLINKTNKSRKSKKKIYYWMIIVLVVLLTFPPLSVTVIATG